MECSICLDEFKRDDDVYTMKTCGHNFHRKCILKWFTHSNTCPYCRERVDNIFYVKTKNLIKQEKKVIVEVLDQSINFYNKNFDKLLDSFELVNLFDLIILNNVLELKYIQKNKEKKKKIYFVDQNYCIYFFRFIHHTYQLNHMMIRNNYGEGGLL